MCVLIVCFVHACIVCMCVCIIFWCLGFHCHAYTFVTIGNNVATIMEPYDLYIPSDVLASANVIHIHVCLAVCVCMQKDL